MKKGVFTPRKQIWICKIAIKTTFSSHRNSKVESLILMFFFLKQKLKQNVRFQLRRCWKSWWKACFYTNAEKVGEKACFYTRKLIWVLKNCYENHFFFQSKSQAKILNLDAFFEAKNGAKCTLSVSKILKKLVKKSVFTPRKPIWVLKISIKTTFSSNRNPKPKSLISMLFLEQIKEEKCTFSTKSAWNLALDMNHKYETGWKYEIKYSNDIQAHRVGQPISGKNKVNKHFI